MASIINKMQLSLPISKAMDFLFHSQLPYGEFKTYASSEKSMEAESYFDSSPFATSFILYAIGFADGKVVQEITAKAIDFLLKEAGESGLWSYWSSRNPQRNLLPPDLDDTCCISYILKKSNCLPYQNIEIILANKNNDGRFYTWVLPRSIIGSEFIANVYRVFNSDTSLAPLLFREIDDIDGVVNANVLLYLGENEDTRKAIDYLIDIVNNGSESSCSRYYPDRHSFYYMLSRAYFNGVSSLAETKSLSVNRIISIQEDNGSFGSELLTALSVCSLLNFGNQSHLLSKAIEYLLETQNEDGSWRRFPMFLGPAPYYGSEELTTAFCIEALTRYSLLL